MDTYPSSMASCAHGNNTYQNECNVRTCVSTFLVNDARSDARCPFLIILKEITGIVILMRMIMLNWLKEEREKRCIN